MKQREIINKLHELTNVIEAQCSLFNFTDKRVRKTTLLDGIAFKLLLSQKGATGHTVTSKLNLFKYKNKKECVSRISYIEREQQLTEDNYIDLYNATNKYIINNFQFNKNNHVAIDGTYSYTELKTGTGLHSHKYLSTGFFDTTNKIPLQLQNIPSKNERKGVLTNLDKCGSIIILDMGYSGYNFFKHLNEQHISFVCRIQDKMFDRCTLQTKLINNENDVLYFQTDKTVIRFVKYTINKKKYCLATNLLDIKTYTIDVLSYIYHERWQSEEYFKCLKKSTRFDTMNDKSIVSINKSLACMLFVTQLIYLFSHLFSINKSHIVNKTSLFYGLYSEFLLRLLYNKKYSSKYSIRFIIRFIQTYIQIIVSSIGKSNPRICKNSSCKWYIKTYQKNNKNK